MAESQRTSPLSVIKAFRRRSAEMAISASRSRFTCSWGDTMGDTYGNLWKSLEVYGTMELDGTLWNLMEVYRTL